MLLFILVWKEGCKRSVECHVFAQSPPGRRPNDKYPSTLRTALDLCKNVSLQCYLVATVIDKQSLPSQICVYIHIIFIIWRCWSGKRNIKTGTAIQGNLPAGHFGQTCQMLVSPALRTSAVLFLARQPPSGPGPHLS